MFEKHYICLVTLIQTHNLEMKNEHVFCAIGTFSKRKEAALKDDVNLSGRSKIHGEQTCWIFSKKNLSLTYLGMWINSWPIEAPRLLNYEWTKREEKIHVHFVFLFKSHAINIMLSNTFIFGAIISIWMRQRLDKYQFNNSTLRNYLQNYVNNKMESI